MRFQKRPMIVDAEQYTGPMDVPVGEPIPSAPRGVHWRQPGDSPIMVPFVTTAQAQEVRVCPGDWVIAETVPDRYYPCERQIFQQTYTAVGEGVDAAKLEAVCRKALAQEFDDVCWLDLYKEIGVVLGVPYDPKLLPKLTHMSNCSRYFDCMKDGKPYATDDPDKMPTWSMEMNLPSGKAYLIAKDVKVLTPDGGPARTRVRVGNLVGPKVFVNEFFKQYADVGEALKPESELVFRSLDGYEPLELRIRGLLVAVEASVLAQGMVLCDGIELVELVTRKDEPAKTQ